MAVQTINNLVNRANDMDAPATTYNSGRGGSQPTTSQPLPTAQPQGFASDSDGAAMAMTGFGGAVDQDQPPSGGSQGGTPGGTSVPMDQDGTGVPESYASDPASTHQAAMGFNATEGTSVADRAAEIARTDSAFMRQADTIGRQYGNRRGLLNSSLAGQAGMVAAMQSVLPMAQQDAQTQANANLSTQQYLQRRAEAASQEGVASRLSAQEFEQASNLSEQDFQQQFGMSREQYRQQLEIQRREYQQQSAMANQQLVNQMISASQQFGFAQQMSAQEAQQRLTELQADYQNNSLLSQQQFQQNWAMSDQEFQQNTGLSRQQYEQELEMQERRIGSELELAMMDAESRQTLMAMERDMRESLANIEVSAADRERASTMVTDMHELFMESQRSILSNPDLPANERNALLEGARTNLMNQTQMIEALFGIDVSWTDEIVQSGGSTGGTTSSGSTGGTTGGSTGSTGSSTVAPTPKPDEGAADDQTRESNAKSEAQKEWNDFATGGKLF